MIKFETNNTSNNPNLQETNLLNSFSDSTIVLISNHLSHHKSDSPTTDENNLEIKNLAKDFNRRLAIEMMIIQKKEKSNSNKKYFYQAYESLSDETEWSDNFNDESSISTSQSFSTKSTKSSRSSNRSKKRKKKDKHKHTKKTSPSDDALCKQSLAIIILLGTVRTRKLDLKHEPKSRRTAFLEWLSNIEVTFNSCKHTKHILKDCNSNNKIRKVKYASVNRMVYAI